MQGKTILITGTSSGFGKLAVPRILARGHLVVAGIRGGEERLRTLFADELRAYPGRLRAIDLHMEKAESLEAARRMVEGDLGGRLDVLVNNAGFGLLGPVETQSPEQIRQQFEVNFFGPVLLTRLLLPALRAAKGRVLNISSIGGRMTFPFYGTYNATKHALESHTEGLYYEVRRQGVQVGLIEPGAFRTEFAARSLVFGAAARDPGTPYAGQSELFEAWMRRNMSLAGDADKVARVIARLCDSRRVPIRTLVGLDARLAVAMRWLLPEHWRVALMERLFRRAVLGA